MIFYKDEVVTQLFDFMQNNFNTKLADYGIDTAGDEFEFYKGYSRNLKNNQVVVAVDRYSSPSLNTDYDLQVVINHGDKYDGSKLAEATADILNKYDQDFTGEIVFIPPDGGMPAGFVFMVNKKQYESQTSL